MTSLSDRLGCELDTDLTDLTHRTDLIDAIDVLAERLADDLHRAREVRLRLRLSSVLS